MESTQSLPRQASQSTLCVHVDPKNEPVSTATPLLDLDDATLVPKGWPTSPSRIKHPLPNMLLHGAFDMALFAFSSCFLVFSLVVMHYDQAPTSDNSMATNVLTRATKYGPTIFPLLFASVVGRATHTILLWRLEKGERIKVLDMLATSTSLTSTVTSQIQLRQISVLSVPLVAIWALSPIGGQASLRQMSIETVLERSDSSFQYVVPNKVVIHLSSPELWSVGKLFTTAIFAAPSTKGSSVDLWGNVKIPKVEKYERVTEPDTNGWFNTRLEDDDLVVYSSFVGVPIRGAENMTATTDYNFHLQTEYLHVSCASFNMTARTDFILPSDTMNVTGYDGVIWWSKHDAGNRSKIAHEILKPIEFGYSTAIWEGGFLSCSAETTYLEAEVTCAVNSTCQAVKIRRSRLPQLSPAFTVMDSREGYNMRLFMTWLMEDVDIDQKYIGKTNDLTSYLNDPSLRIAPDLPSTEDDNWNNRSQISNETWSDRFGQLLNAYWTCIYGVYTVSGGIDNATSYFWDTNATFVPEKNGLDSDPNSAKNFIWGFDYTAKSKVWSSQGSKYEHIEVMVAHKPWAITLAIASLVLIAFSIIPPLVRHFLTNGPDIAMNFSSLATRNNSHIPIPAGGSFLPAADRFRLLRDVRLRFADAEGKSDVGNLVIASESVEKAEFVGVRKERLYE